MKITAITYFYFQITSLGKGEVSGSSPDEGTRGIARYQWDYHYRRKKLFRGGRPFSDPLFFFEGRYLEVHHTIDDIVMATIRKNGNRWQALIRRKNYVGPRSRTFLSRDQAQSWADAVEDRTKKVVTTISLNMAFCSGAFIWASYSSKVFLNLKSKTVVSIDIKKALIAPYSISTFKQ